MNTHTSKEQREQRGCSLRTLVRLTIPKRQKEKFQTNKIKDERRHNNMHHENPENHKEIH